MSTRIQNLLELEPAPQIEPGYALIARPYEGASEYWAGGYWTLYSIRAMRFQDRTCAANYWRERMRDQYGDCQILEVYECKV